MAIFGNITSLETTRDAYLNYSFGVVLILCHIISTCLNPIVFIYQHNQPPSIASTLYKLLTASDFLTNLYRPLLLSYELIKPGLDDLYTEATIPKRMRSHYFAIFGSFSMTITTCLAVMRYIAVRFPYYRPNKRILFLFIAVELVATVSYYSYSYFLFDGKWIRFVQMGVTRSKGDFFLIKFSTAMIISLAASCLTVYDMVKRRTEGCMTVLIMNAGLVFYFCITRVFDNTKRGNTDVTSQATFFATANFSIILSAFNPLVIVCLNSGIKTFIREKLCYFFSRQNQSPETAVTCASL